MENKYWKTKMYQTILIILLIGSLNWGTTALGYNFVEIIKNLLNNSLKTETYIDKIIYFLVALAGITLAMNRELWSPCIEDFSNTRPSPPRLLTAIPGDRSVQLSWSASTNATSYKIKGVDQSNNPLFRDAYNLSYTVNGLINGTSYTFFVVGKNSAGESGDLSANRMGPIIPSVTRVSTVPINVTATPGNSSANVNWKAPLSNGGTAITSYTVTSNNGQTVTTNGTTTTATVNGLTNGTPYTFTVRATNARGSSDPSDASTQVTPILPSAALLPTLTIRKRDDTIYLDVQFYSPTAEIIIDSYLSDFGIDNGQMISWGGKVINYNDVGISNGVGTITVVGSTDYTREVVFELVDGSNTVTDSIKMIGNRN